jgi:uncharacterized protein YjbI with pentapeptide repeats
VTWLVLPVIVLVTAGLVAKPLDPFDGFDQPATHSELRLTLSVRHNLSGVDMRGRDLSHAYLYGKNPSHADLAAANLYDANLSHARLRGADLNGARLVDTDLSGADLRQATLAGSDMSSADMTGADLQGTDLTGVLGDGSSDARTLYNTDIAQTDTAVLASHQRRAAANRRAGG